MVLGWSLLPFRAKGISWRRRFNWSFFGLTKLNQLNTPFHQASLALPLGCGRSPRWVLRVGLMAGGFANGQKLRPNRTRFCSPVDEPLQQFSLAGDQCVDVGDQITIILQIEQHLAVLAEVLHILL